MNPEVKRLHDEALALIPPGATHDRALCPVCRTDDVAQSEGSPSGTSRPDGSASTAPAHPEGGTRQTMSDISKETHEQLLTAAVNTAKAEAASQIQTLTTQLETATSASETLTKERDEQAAKITTLTEENTRLNGELDTAQVQLKSVKDEVADLKKQVDEAAAKEARQEVASKRLEQVKNLGLFDDDYASKKSDEWAAMSDEDWAARLEDYKQLKPAGSTTSGGGTAGSTDTASAMSGTGAERGAEGEQQQQDNANANNGEQMTKGRSARRSLLGVG